ncbi:MAG: cupin domain-containing protein [Candidatus Babeliales bacterium]|jgi:mannose-6-phosphate isomerase-like protein (cupin superfamily)
MSTSLTKNGYTVKPSQLVKLVDKEWGHEEWIANTSAYCGKKLVFKGGYQCSMHHHKVKDETFYIQSGTVVLDTEYNGLVERRMMNTGDTMHILPHMWHRITALTSAEVLEFSTLHMDEDSYRKSTSGKADLKAMNLSEHSL